MDIHKFNLKESTIEVFIFDISEPVIVDKNDFEDWALKDGRFEWVHDGINYKGEHYQKSGTMEAGDYWESASYAEKVSDLNDYLIFKK